MRSEFGESETEIEAKGAVCFGLLWPSERQKEVHRA